jgi:excisionase family DNA binding protein
MGYDEPTQVPQSEEEGLSILMSVIDVARTLRIAPKTVHKLVRDRKLGCVQISSKRRLFTQEQVQAYIDSCKVEMRVDKKRALKLSCPRKGGEKSSRVLDRANLRKEMRSWL